MTAFFLSRRCAVESTRAYFLPNGFEKEELIDYVDS